MSTAPAGCTLLAPGPEQLPLPQVQIKAEPITVGLVYFCPPCSCGCVPEAADAKARGIRQSKEPGFELHTPCRCPKSIFLLFPQVQPQHKAQFQSGISEFQELRGRGIWKRLY